ncbi:hypothetical protein EV426DRAFT_700495 [Tirmania nivea]|nr:hypothetical protein EV426DRAFT_700495 [Tirmania nivea]
MTEHKNLSKVQKSESRERSADRPRYGSTALLDTSNSDIWDLTDGSSWGRRDSEEIETSFSASRSASAYATTYSETTKPKLNPQTTQCYKGDQCRSHRKRKTVHGTFASAMAVRQHLESEDNNKRYNSRGEASPSPSFELCRDKYGYSAMFDIYNNYSFDLADSSDSTYNSSDDDATSRQITISVPAFDDSSIPKYTFGNKEKRKIVHRRFVAPAAIAQHSQCDSWRSDCDERILQAACIDARFDARLGRPVVADDQPCCCQQCQPWSPRSTTPAPPIKEGQPEETGLCTDTNCGSASPRSSSSSSRKQSGTSYRSYTYSYSLDSNESYVPSSRNLAVIEQAIDPLECEIVDASFWVWRWPSDKEETLLEDSTRCISPA